MGCCFQDLFSIARNILLQLPLSFFSIRFVGVRVVHPYSDIDTTAALFRVLFTFFRTGDKDVELKNYIMNWITKTRKSGEHLRTTYGNTGQLFRPYQVSSAVYTAISTTADKT